MASPASQASSFNTRTSDDVRSTPALIEAGKENDGPWVSTITKCNSELKDFLTDERHRSTSDPSASAVGTTISIGESPRPRSMIRMRSVVPRAAIKRHGIAWCYSAVTPDALALDKAMQRNPLRQGEFSSGSCQRGVNESSLPSRPELSPGPEAL